MAKKRDKTSEELWAAIDALGKGQHLSMRARERQRESEAENRKAQESLHRIVMDASKRNHTLDRAFGIAMFYEIIIFLTLFAGRVKGDDPVAIADVVGQQYQRAIEFFNRPESTPPFSPVGLEGFKDAGDRYLSQYLAYLARREDVRVADPFAGSDSLRELIKDEGPGA